MDRLFATARTEPPVTSFSETRARVEAEAVGASHSAVESTTELRRKLHRQKHTIMISTGIGVLAAGLVGFLSWNFGGTASTQGTVQEAGGGRIPAEHVVTEKKTSVLAGPAAPTVQGVPGTSAGVEFTKIAGAKKEGKKPEQGGGAEKDSTGMFLSPAPFITGVRMIEMDRKDLGRLGLQPAEAGVRCVYMEGSEMLGFEVSMQGLSFIQTLDEEWKKEGLVVSAFRPMFITDDFGNQRMSIREDDDPTVKAEQALLNELVQKMEEGTLSADEIDALKSRIEEETAKINLRELTSGKLVPVLVRTGHSYTDEDNANKRWRPDCIFWYQATPEFIAALPEGVRVSLERELRLASLLQQKPDNEALELFVSRQPLEIRQDFDSLWQSDDGSTVAGVTGEAMIGSFSAASGAITATTVVPNPANDRAVVRYRLGSARYVSLGLYDVSGKLIRPLSEPTITKAGENLMSVDLKGVTPGMYLLVIATDKGERAVQRVIVQ